MHIFCLENRNSFFLDYILVNLKKKHAWLNCSERIGSFLKRYFISFPPHLHYNRLFYNYLWTQSIYPRYKTALVLDLKSIIKIIFNFSFLSSIEVYKNVFCTDGFMVESLSLPTQNLRGHYSMEQFPTWALCSPVLLHHTLRHVDILLEKTTPRGDINIHLFWTRHFPLLAEYFPLAAQFRFSSYQRIQKLNLNIIHYSWQIQIIDWIKDIDMTILL